MAEEPVNLDAAFKGGSDATQNVINQWRQNSAMNALTKQYGDVAGDPQAWAADQQNYLNSQLQPLKIQQAQRENAAGQSAVGQYGPQAGDPDAWNKNVNTADAQNSAQRQGQYRALVALQNSVDPKTGSVDPAKFDQIVGSNAQVLGMDPNHVAPLKQMLTAPGGAQHLDTMEQALLAPVKTTGAPVPSYDPSTGQSGFYTKDQYGNMHFQAAQGGNMPVAAARVPIAQQTANNGSQNAATGARRENVYAANQTYGPDQNPGGNGGNPPLAKGLPQPDVNLIGGPGNSTAAPSASASPLDRLPPKGRQMAIGQATQITNQASNLDNTNRILDQTLSQITPFTAGSGSLLKDLPGSAQANLKANLDTLKAQGMMSWIASLKNSNGQTGIGRVLQSEARNAEALYGNMEQDQSAKQLQFHMQLFRQSVNNLFQHSQAAYKAQWGTDPYSAIGMKAPAGGVGGGAPAGKTYTYDPKTGTLQ